jgi:amidase
VPISHSQDTPGPMARSVREAALLLSAMTGVDPDDTTTVRAVARDYAVTLSMNALSGLRVGVIRPDGMSADLTERFNTALAVLRAAGAVLVEVKRPQLDGLGEAELLVLKTELKADLNAYLKTTPTAVTTRTLDQLIVFNRINAAAEMPYFGQETFEDAVTTRGLDDPAYLVARRKSFELAAKDGIDAMLNAGGAQILVQPSYAAAWLSDPVYGDQYSGPSASRLPAVAGYPHLTVPMGLVRGLPVGLSFIGSKEADALVLGAGYAYEQRSRARVRPGYLPSTSVGHGLDGTR